MNRAHLLLIACATPLLWAAGPVTRPTTEAVTRPVDDTVDWLMQQATPAASGVIDKPISKPAPPFEKESEKEVFGIRHGIIVTSDGEKMTGQLSTTLDKPLRIWDEKEAQYHDVAFSRVQSIESKVLWERDEKEWHFRASGSDIKEYSGKTYPARELEYTVALSNGRQYVGGISSPIYLDTPSGVKTFILHKRDKGEVGQALKDLVYVKRVELGDATSQPTR